MGHPLHPSSLIMTPRKQRHRIAEDSEACLLAVFGLKFSDKYSLSLPLDNGFIPDCLLEEVMKALDLVSEPEY